MQESDCHPALPTWGPLLEAGSGELRHLATSDALSPVKLPVKRRVAVSAVRLLTFVVNKMICPRVLQMEGASATESFFPEHPFWKRSPMLSWSRLAARGLENPAFSL